MLGGQGEKKITKGLRKSVEKFVSTSQVGGKTEGKRNKGGNERRTG